MADYNRMLVKCGFLVFLMMLPKDNGVRFLVGATVCHMEGVVAPNQSSLECRANIKIVQSGITVYLHISHI